MAEAAIKYTQDQLQAIENRGGQLLVSAAAGSGKTRVLVERLLRRISAENSDCDVDDFLVITYTKAAAAELKGKIMDGIGGLIAHDPENRRLRRQANLCYRAPIGTIHSFCAGILRENAHLLGISPEFRVADESECAVIKQRAMDSVLDRKYDSIEENAGFAQLADTLGAGRDDSRLVRVITDMFSKLQCHPYPEKWANEQIKTLTNIKNITDVSDTAWGKVILSAGKSAAEYWLGEMRRILDEAGRSEELGRAYGESVARTCGSIESFIKAADAGWDQAYDAAGRIEFPKVKPLKGDSFDDIKELRTRCRKEMASVTKLFDGTSAQLLEDMAAVAPEMTELLRLVVEFGREYAGEKLKAGVLDFSDQEHMAVALLVNERDGKPTRLAEELSRCYEEIMVDEYQDVNAVQEMIFRAISKNGENIFMVGDVKQSIYRFRLADPTIFLKKYNSFPGADAAAAGEGRKVILSRNFRSRAGILDAVNYVFSNIMSTQFGEMDYTSREFLYPGADYPERDQPEVELDVLDMKGSGDMAEDETPDKSAAEADFVAGRIAELAGNMEISEAGGTRKLRYGDIAILMRAPGGKAEVFAGALKARGIPAASASDAGSFFDAAEVSDMVSLLEVIDNPLQDIPLIAAMKSPVFAFTEDELAKARTEDGGEFYCALKAYAEKDEKAREFLRELEGYRRLAPEMKTGELICRIYDRTGVMGVVGAMPGGAAKQKNLMTLLEYAESFESAGFRGLFGFVTYMRRLRELGKSPEGAGGPEEADSVQIMSIHKSKGLEFPVVFLCDLSKGFNKEDFHKPLLVHPEMGIGAARIDTGRKISYPTIAKQAVSLVMKEEMMAEELRVLYVAMTRAREKLIMTCTFADAGRELSKLGKRGRIPVPPQILKGTSKMSDWVIMAAAARPECGALRGEKDEAARLPDGFRWKAEVIGVCGGEKPGQAAEPAVAAGKPEVPAKLLEEIREKLSFRYPYPEAADIPSKLTATQLKGRVLDEEARDEARPAGKYEFTPVFRRPSFRPGSGELTPAQAGAALHLVLQYARLNMCVTPDGAEAELERLEKSGIITAPQRTAADAGKIAGMMASPTGELILRAEEVMREFKFSVLMPADEYYDTDSGDEVLLQGVVDCCLKTEDGLVIIDYKTDRIRPEEAEERAKAYAPQINAYAGAMERITGIRTAKKILYFFTPEQAVIIK